MSTATSSPQAQFGQQFIGGVVLTVLGLFAISLSIEQYLYAAIVGAGIVAIGLRMIMVAMTRAHGQRVEQRAIASLELPATWICELNVLLDEGGDLDILLTSPLRNQFAVEIKSYKGVLVKTGLWFAGREALVKLNGSKIRPDPIDQVRKSAGKFGATPVLWLPEAKSNKILRLKDDLVVVQGSQKLLKHALGIV